MSNKSKNDSSNSKIKGLLQQPKYIIIGLVLIFGYCAINSTEDYSNGERIGFMTKFSRQGRYWKSWEGELNLTQTGMNTSSTFHFSLDNDKPTDMLVATIDSAVNRGWKIKLVYHQTFGKNWLNNRGETNYFINSIEVLDKHSLGNNNQNTSTQTQGRVIDTIYVVIDKSEVLKKMKKQK